MRSSACAVSLRCLSLPPPPPPPPPPPLLLPFTKNERGGFNTNTEGDQKKKFL